MDENLTGVDPACGRDGSGTGDSPCGVRVVRAATAISPNRFLVALDSYPGRDEKTEQGRRDRPAKSLTTPVILNVL
jgi:hypothetical protein